MDVQNSTATIATGAAIGTVAGAGTGLVVGSKKANKILGDFKQYVGLNADQYVAAKKTKALHELKSNASTKGMKNTAVEKALKKVVEKAKADFPAVSKKVEELSKKAKETKNKWIIGLTAAGAAIGAGVGLFLASKKAPAAQAEAPEAPQAE